MNKIRMNRTRWEFLVTLIGLGSLIFAIEKSRAIDFEQYQQYRNTIAQLQQKESDFIQIILSSRYELYVSYDPLVNNLNDQKRIQQQLENIPNFLGTKEKIEIQNLLKERDTLLTQKESLSEWFKSQNALLKNSLRYLPLLASQLEEKVANEEESSINRSSSLTSLRIIFNDLLRNILLYNITNNEELTSAIEQQIERLSRLRKQDRISDREFPIQLAISHANIILTQKPQVEELTAQLLISSPQQTESLANLYHISYQKASQTIGVYRFLKFGLFFALLVWFNYLLLKKFYWIRKNHSVTPQSNTNNKAPQYIESPELSETEKVLEKPVNNDDLESTETARISKVIAEVDIKNNRRQDNNLQSSQSTKITESIDEELQKKDEKEKEVFTSREINEEKREPCEILETNKFTNKAANKKDEFWEDFQSVALLEAEEEKQLETREILQISEPNNLVETDDRGSIAILPIYPLNSKNLHLWVQQVNQRTTSLIVAVRNHIQQKPCKIWLDRINCLGGDRFAKFKKKKNKNKLE